MRIFRRIIMAFLSKEIADAFCTITALGFANSEIQQRGAAVFEYDTDGDQPNYERAAAIFAGLGTPVNIQHSPKQIIMPYILGTNLPPAQRQNFIDSLTDANNAVESMMLACTRGNNPPRGAYIGMVFTVDAETGFPLQSFVVSAVRHVYIVFRDAGFFNSSGPG
jgi:hypothetical protein